MSSYKEIRKFGEAAEAKQKADAIRAAKLDDERLNAAIASVNTDINRELTKIGEAFGKSGLFGRYWRVRFYPFNAVRGSEYPHWELETRHPASFFQYVTCIRIRFLFGNPAPSVDLGSFRLCYLKGLWDSYIPGEGQVGNKIRECLTELNKKLRA